MKWLIFLFILECGWLPNGAFSMYEKTPPEAVYLNGAYFFDMQAELIIFDHLYLNGGAKTILHKSPGLIFDPKAVTYKFETGLRYNMIDIFFRHYCMHPIMTYMYHYQPSLIWEGWYNEIGIRIEGKIGGNR